MARGGSKRSQSDTRNGREPTPDATHVPQHLAPSSSSGSTRGITPDSDAGSLTSGILRVRLGSPALNPLFEEYMAYPSPARGPASDIGSTTSTPSMREELATMAAQIEGELKEVMARLEVLAIVEAGPGEKEAAERIFVRRLQEVLGAPERKWPLKEVKVMREEDEDEETI